MNKKELEKLFDGKFNFKGIFGENSNAEEKIKHFIFNIVIPEVLKSVCEYEWKELSKAKWIGYKTIEKNAKDLYGVEL